MRILRGLFASIVLVATFATNALAERPLPEMVLRDWYKLVLALVRHTPTYSPPVASRAFAYLDTTAYEAVASGSDKLHSMAGQLKGLQPLPKRETGAKYDTTIVLQAALASAATNFFANTGPTGQRAVKATATKLEASVSEGISPEIAARSKAYGELLAQHIWQWSASDGGAEITNLGFPESYQLREGKANWVPTSTIQLQQGPLLPRWGSNRTFALPDAATCDLPPPPEYNEDKSSEFYRQAQEVYDAKKSLTKDQRAMARFWSDDPMLSPTPPGHWISIAMQIFERDKVPLERQVDVLVRMGVAAADAFIGCWNTKYKYDLLRPVTYIRRTIDPKWESTLTTPPFPEYPSGHSTVSGAEAAVLTQIFGDNFAFEDATHERDGLAARNFSSFEAATSEAAVSRLYGGIHFRAAIERGLDQGRCIAKYANALRTMK